MSGIETWTAEEICTKYNSLVKQPKELLQYLQKQQTHRFQRHSATFSANTVPSPLKVGLKESVMLLGFGSPLNTPQYQLLIWKLQFAALQISFTFLNFTLRGGKHTLCQQQQQQQRSEARMTTLRHCFRTQTLSPFDSSQVGLCRPVATFQSRVLYLERERENSVIIGTKR